MTVASETWSHADASAISFWTPSSSSATRSSRATGAERWEIPTTRTLIFGVPDRLFAGGQNLERRRIAQIAWGRRRIEWGDSCLTSEGGGRDLVPRVLVRLPLLVVGEDLQLDRQVDLAYVDALGHRDHDRSEVEDAGDARRD